MVYSSLQFYAKYYIFYGLCSEWARFEGMGVPAAPYCLLWIDGFSDIWKFFDVGMYRFLRDYLFRPITHKSVITHQFLSKSVASFFVFSFVSIWHGGRTIIIWWAVSNFVGVTVETVIRKMSQSQFCDRLSERIGVNFRRRVDRALTSVIYLFFVLTQIGFITKSSKIADEARELFHQNICSNFHIMLFISYCLCQTMLDLKRFLRVEDKLIQEKSKAL